MAVGKKRGYKLKLMGLKRESQEKCLLRNIRKKSVPMHENPHPEAWNNLRYLVEDTEEVDRSRNALRPRKDTLNIP